MNHPKPEEWVPYMYGESGPEARRELKAHLQDCVECRQQLAEWQSSLKRLDSWRVPKQKVANRFTVSALKLAMAAACLILAGFVGGRLSGTTAHSDQARKALESDLRSKLIQELSVVVQEQVKQATISTVQEAAQQSERIASAYAREFQAQRSEDRHAIEIALERLDSQRVTDLAYLKKELDTLAVNTDVGLRHTTEGLVQLASHQGQGGGSPSLKTTQ